MPNRLAQETSPYLQQHCENPVDWHAWGPQALALARATDRPILLSIGYSACFLGALKFVAGKEKVKIPDEAKVSADVGIGPRDDGQGFGIAVKLTISVPGVDKAVVEDLVQKAHVVCPYSHATKGNIDVELQVAA